VHQGDHPAWWPRGGREGELIMLLSSPSCVGISIFSTAVRRPAAGRTGRERLPLPGARWSFSTKRTQLEGFWHGAKTAGVRTAWHPACGRALRLDGGRRSWTRAPRPRRLGTGCGPGRVHFWL